MKSALLRLKIMFGDVQNTPGTAAPAATAVPPKMKPVSGNPNPSGSADPKPAHVTPLNTTHK